MQIECLLLTLHYCLIKSMLFPGNGMSLQGVCFNILFGLCSLMAILVLLKTLTHSHSLFIVKTFTHWRSYIALHITHLILYRYAIDFSVVHNVNPREGISIIVALIGNAALHCTFIVISSVLARKCQFPKEISIKSAFRSGYVVICLLWSFFAIMALLYGEIYDFFSYLFLLYTTLSVAAGRKSPF